MLRSLSLIGTLLTTAVLVFAPMGSASAAPVDTASPCSMHGPLPPTWDDRWKNGLSTDLDIDIIGEDIVSYHIQWSDGSWSETYFPGDNDIDWVDSDRRVWSYFYDHDHTYLSCPIS